MARLLSIKATIQGVGWQRIQERLRNEEIGARQMAQSRWLIGSSLPYASHWIEEGWRNDPRFGTVHVLYRTPATYFMRDSIAGLKGEIRARRPTSGIVGAATFSGVYMMRWAQRIAENMRRLLNQRVYSLPVPTRNGRPLYQRTNRLFKSIKAYRA